MQTQPPANLRNLPIQLEKQRATYLNLTTNDAEKNFVLAFMGETAIIKDAPLLQSNEYLVKKISELRLFMGTTKDVDSKQLKFESDCVRNNYSFLRLEEIDLAFTLFKQGKLLPLKDLPNYPNFSSLFVSQILNAYVLIRANMIDTLSKRNLYEETKKLPEPQHQVTDMQYMITQVAKELKENVNYSFLLNTVYAYLYRTQKISPTQQDIDAACKYADRKYLIYTQTRSTTLDDIMNGLNGKDKAYLLETYARECFLKFFFDQTDLQKILDSVVISDFQTPNLEECQ